MSFRNEQGEIELPAWVYPFAALVLFVVGAVVIYAALAFVNLDIRAANWSGLDRVVYVVLAWLWARYVVKSALEVEADGEQ